MKRWIYRIVFLLLILVALICIWNLASYFLESKKQQSQFTELALLVEENRPSPDRPVDPTAPEVTIPDSVTGQTVTILPEYAPLYEMNPHMIGWMQLEGTKLNYPVMYNPESRDHYLKRNFQQEYSAHGCLYIQENCRPGESDNLIIYGHNMKDGSMFAPLHGYQKKDFWETHPEIRFDTLTSRQNYAVLAVFDTTASMGQGFAYHEFVDAADAAEFDAFVSKCKSLAYYETGVSAEYGDKLITLSTCEYSQENGRLVVVAKLLED